MDRLSADLLSDEEQSRYARQLLLPQLGNRGQKKLREGRVLVIGAGGLGSPVIEYLAAAGVGTLGIIDDDSVEESNLHRQVVHSLSDLGEPKVTSAANRIRALAGDLVHVNAHNVRLSPDNAWQIVQNYDVVVDGADNFPTRYLVSEVCTDLGIPVVWGSILGFDAQVSVFWSRPPTGAGITLRDVFPKPPEPGVVPSCGEAGVIGALCGQAGSVMAMEAIKLISETGNPLMGRLLVIDTLRARYTEVPVMSADSLPADPFFPPDVPSFTEIDVADLRGSNRKLVDVRERVEFLAGHIPGAELHPLSQLDKQTAGILSGSAITIYCQTGRRALLAAKQLQEWGAHDIVLLAGSYEAWKTHEQRVPFDEAEKSVP